MKNKKFIAISSEILNGKTCLLSTSSGELLQDENGLEFEAMIKFLFDLVYKRGKKDSITFVCYAFSRDNEFIFSTLPKELKDKLFKAFPVKDQITRIEQDNESIDELFYSSERDSDDYLKAEYERKVNALALAELVEVRYGDYHITLINGKTLTIRKKGKSISIYDIAGFFKDNDPQKRTLRATVKLWLDKDIVILDRAEFNTLRLKGVTEIERLKVRSFLETKIVTELITKLDAELKKIDINLTRYHGASAISSHWLSKIDAKGHYHSYKFRRQLAPELFKARNQAFYGGRAEQLQLGTVKDVFIYDINSAYAYSCLFLPSMLRKPFYRQRWEPCPFSLWFCEYDFTNIDYLPFGLLPNRNLRGFTQYTLRGSGYFWQPEISFILTYFPECVKIKGGYVFDYEIAPFTQGVQMLYGLRVELQRQGNPLEKVIKLALASIYGKFCQHNGKGFYYNLFYAGFITSLTRTMLLQATRGQERDVICFQTDAIHTAKPLQNLPVSDNIGEYKRSYYEKVTYLNSGVWRGERDNRIVKEKTQGFRTFDFEKALLQMNDKRTYNALCEFFVGHSLFTQNMFSGADYLSHIKQDKEMTPTGDDKTAMRLFDACKVDLTKESLGSKPLNIFSGKESALYRQGNYKMSDAGIDTIEAGRI